MKLLNKINWQISTKQKCVECDKKINSIELGSKDLGLVLEKGYLCKDCLLKAVADKNEEKEVLKGK